jgi:tRNA nucleotidyltransferase (CCA-adding enzyme)
MADYIYTMETRLTPDQQRAVAVVQEAARAHEMNVYVTGGTIRDLITGFPIRDLDFSVEGNTLKLQKNLEAAGVVVQGVDEDLKILYVQFPGNVRADIAMARSETYEKPGKAPIVHSATIVEDLRRRDFTVNAMALSLNPGSRGLLLDPTNGAADIEAKVIRILHNYAFLDDPSRLLRAVRFMSRFEWPLEERTQARFESAKENDYMQYVSPRSIGHEVEALIYEADPLKAMKALEKEGWLDVIHPKFALSKVDTSGVSQVMKFRQQMTDVGMNPDMGPVVLYYLTKKFNDKEVADLRRILPRKDTVTAWKNLEDDAKNVAKQLAGREAATNSGAWKTITGARPELILFLALTSKQGTVTQKIHNFFGKWQQVKTKLPFPEMAELRITPALPEWNKINEEAFLLLLDGKLRSHNEIIKFLKPYEPPPPPPPPPAPGRGRRKAAGAGTGKPGRPPRVKAEPEEEAEEELTEVLKGGPLDAELDDVEVDEDENEDEDRDDDEDGDEDEEARPAKRGRKPGATSPAPKPAPAKAVAPVAAVVPVKGAKAPAATSTLKTVAEKVGSALGTAVKSVQQAVAPAKGAPVKGGAPAKAPATPAKAAVKVEAKFAAKTPAKVTPAKAAPTKAAPKPAKKAPAKKAGKKH